jgi:dihydrolipoamide dehydrogenase
MEEYDVITIGAGGAAYPAAFRLKRSGFSVIMIDEKGVMSGNCLSEGCVPSKAIIETVHNYKIMREFTEFKLNYGDIIKRKDHVQEMRYRQHAAELKEADLEIIKGTAKLLDTHTVEVDTGKEKMKLGFRHLIIGSGAYTYKLNIPGSEYAITSADLFKIDPAVKKIPDCLVVIGGGYIGVETASFMSILGSKVTLIERSDRLLTDMDAGIVDKLTGMLPEMVINLNNEVKSIEKAGNKFKTIIVDESGEKVSILSDMVMMATGREPLIPEGTAQCGIEMDRHGIKVNSAMQTNIPHIYATGDVNGITPLFHAAKRQSLIAAANIMAGDTAVERFDSSSVPFTLFSIPNMSFVGMMPDNARQGKIEYSAVTYPMVEDSMAEIHNEICGEITMLFDKNMKIIGGYVIGNDAGNLINEIALGIHKGLNARDFAEMAHQHPMTFEGLDSAARKLF